MLSNLPSVFPATLGHPVCLLPWEQDFEKEEERGDSGCAGGSGKHTPGSPGAHSLGGIQVCELPLPGPATAAWGGLGEPPPQPLQPLVSADGDWGCQLAGAPASFCSEDSCLSETRDSRARFHPAAFNNASALLSCPQFQPATSFRKALHLHYLPLEPSGPPTWPF